MFAEKLSTLVRVRPQFEAALAACRQIKAHAPHCRVILTVYEMKRLGRDSAELTALADHLTAHGITLEMLAGPRCHNMPSISRSDLILPFDGSGDRSMRRTS